MSKLVKIIIETPKALFLHLVIKVERSVCVLCGGTKVFNNDTCYRYDCPLCDDSQTDL